MSPLERFAAKFVTDVDCWIWIAAKAHGYGRFRLDNKMVQAHRFSWEVHRGPIPEGLVVDHRCFNRACVNPDHLRLLTAAENTSAPNVQAWTSAVCKNGLHPKEPGERRCEECRIASKRRYRETNRDRVNQLWRERYRERVASS